jgi:formylmethanofuran dehydrogenase subunit E
MSDKEEFYKQLEKVEKFHGHLCGGIVMGTKMSMYAMEYLGFELNQQSKDLMVFTEIDRCMADAVQVVTGCTIGKRTLKLMDYGRFAVTFYKISTGEAIRVTDEDIQNQNKDEEKEELIERLISTPSEELFKIRKVKLNISEDDLPGKSAKTSKCSVCGEVVKDNKYIFRNGKSICKACAIESYYEFID